MRYITLTSLLTLITATAWFLSSKAGAIADPSYTLIITGLVGGIIIILGGCELFANGVECFGDRFDMSHATVGSLLAAVGTALPETIVPVLALIFAKGGHGEGIAVGAILGAPFMLSTLAMFLLGVTVIIHWISKRRPRPSMKVNVKALKFELKYFISVMFIVLLVSLIKNETLNHATAAVLLLVYAVFFYYSLKHEAGEGEKYTDNFHLGIFLGCPRTLKWILIQIAVGLFFIIMGAYLFVDYLTVASVKSGISPLVLSLLITPVATELPEKFNSITWTLKNKDTIGLANITGAMVFQSTIPVSIGLLFTDWSLGGTEMLNIIFAITMAGIILGYVSNKKELPGWLLLTGGLFYLLYIGKVLL
ncbi:Sodium/calcium exchanger membrane region [hydrothermal vent metagenome]|uniref:Sodium/calcium exchanger membrane region n=1 Tax=hydrothermal vent metagenome TaxID=652676 RepID=A0A3B1CT73_9ZZZZ